MCCLVLQPSVTQACRLRRSLQAAQACLHPCLQVALATAASCPPTPTNRLQSASFAPHIPPLLQVALATAGILPSDSDLYATRKVARAVEDAFGVAPLLECWHGQLLEVRLCVGLDLKVG